jgi:hypothetical protein
MADHHFGKGADDNNGTESSNHNAASGSPFRGHFEILPNGHLALVKFGFRAILDDHGFSGAKILSIFNQRVVPHFGA